MRSFSKYLAEQTKPKFSSSEFDVPGVTIRRNRYLDAPSSTITSDQISKAKSSAIDRAYRAGNLGAAERQQLKKTGAGLAQIQKASDRNQEARDRNQEAMRQIERQSAIRAQNKAAYDAQQARQQDAIKKLEAHKKATTPSLGNLFKKPKGKLSPEELAQTQSLARGVEGLATGEATPDYSLETLIPGVGLGMRGARIASAFAPGITKRVTAGAATGLGGEAARKDITKTVQQYSDQSWEAQNQAAKGLASALTFGQVKAEDQPAPKISTMDIVRGVGDALRSKDASGVTPSELASLADSQPVKDAAAGAAVQGISNILAPIPSAAVQLPHMADATRSVRTGAVRNIVPRAPVSTEAGDSKLRNQAAIGTRILSKIQQRAISREQK